MPWAKIDDGWWCHPKVMALSLAASGLWSRALSWSCQQRRDTVPDRFLMMVGADQEHADELVHAGLWIETEHGYRIHDWSEYQEQSLTEKRAEAGRKGGKKSGEARSKSQPDTPSDLQEHEANAKQNEANERSKSQANDEAGALPVPSPPSPTQPGQESARRKRRAPATPLPDGWEPTDDHRQLAADQGVDCDHEAAKFADHAAANDRRQRDWDAAFRTWLRRARDYGATSSARASPGSRGAQYADRYRQAAAAIERQTQ
jgi:hypothetical protein